MIMNHSNIRKVEQIDGRTVLLLAVCACFTSFLSTSLLGHGLYMIWLFLLLCYFELFTMGLGMLGVYILSVVWLAINTKYHISFPSPLLFHMLYRLLMPAMIVCLIVHIPSGKLTSSIRKLPIPENIMLIINVVSLMQKYRIMHNKATTSSNFLLYPVISFLLMFGLLIAGCSDNENEEELPAPDVPDYSTIIVKDIQNMPKNFTFDRVEVKVTGLDWQVIETLIFPYENGQIVMTLPATFPSERLQKVDRRNGDMAGYWTGTSNDGDALVATLGDFFVFNGDTRVGRIALSNWSGNGSSAEKATLVSYQYADRPFILTGSDKSYYYSECSFNKGWNIFANINPSEGSSQKVLRTTTVPESTLFWRLAESYVYNK